MDYSTRNTQKEKSKQSLLGKSVNQKEQNKLRKSTQFLLSLPDIKGKRRTPTPKELQEKYRLNVKGGVPEMKVKSE